MPVDYKSLVRAELKDFSDFLQTLSVAEWEHPTLCEGWQVRHVVGHIALGYSLPLPKVLWRLATQYKFNLPKAAHFESTRFGDENTPAELLKVFDEGTQRKRIIGIASTGPNVEHFLDHMIHQWDIRVPMNRPRQIPKERLIAALDGFLEVKGSTGLAAGKHQAAGLKLRATDVAWSKGEGLEVVGEAMYIILALGGRPMALQYLRGDGVTILKDRIANWNGKQLAPAKV